jgi:hypothetical protein
VVAVSRRARLSIARRSLVAAALLAIGLTSVQLSTPRLALASEGYVETAVTTYTVNPTAGRLDVALDVSFKNTTRSVGNTEYVFYTVFVWLEHAASHVYLQPDSAGGLIVRDKVGKAYDRWAVHVGRVVFYGETKRIHVTYQLQGGAPRSTSDVRVNPAFASFCVVAMGDDGGTARVVAPVGYQLTFDGEGGDLTPTTSGSSTTWSTGKLDKPYDFWACGSGPDPARYNDTILTSPSGQKIDVQAWPTDATWQDQVKTEVDGALTKLEALVGRGLPNDGTIVVREVASGELGAYAGFFDPTSGLAQVGEDYGSDGTVAHELSHAWFNDDLFDSRWMSEGMAEWARVSTVPDTCPEPASFPGQGSPRIAGWVFAGPRSPQSVLDTVDYEYSASCYIVTTLAAKVGPDGMRAALAAMFDRKLAYRSGTTVLDGKAGVLSWREWLDAIDELGMVPAGVADLDFAQNLLHHFGAADVGSLLDKRSAARKTYHALTGSVGDWTLPEPVLRSMGTWQFDAATTAMTDTATTYALLQQADTTLTGIDAVEGPVKALVEGATVEADLVAAEAKAQDELDAAKAVVGAQAALAAPRDVMTTIGLLGSDPSTPVAAAVAAAAKADLAGAKAQAATITSSLAGASQQGLTRVVVAVVVTVVLLLLLALLVRRRRRASARHAMALAQVAAEHPDLAGTAEVALAEGPAAGLPATGFPVAEEAPAAGEATPEEPSTLGT